ncbi:hypothetical protein EPUS_00999 [Endocarpon pusillum Z07020]|uniref:Short-chain dehydrogenase n=1 Tax=Endocarpon pusillum (strain Z07020 / HMAS-L-300199) TaxID=1263415 RepID=U1HT58_ENDPU|nr:uncharacterized protein EPUS_00999 [Endocarpon pusillum Z07020]ERF73745.1 hypothetical protein EPUS_00999 [Endocarpon pusillum Z07020]
MRTETKTPIVQINNQGEEMLKSEASCREFVKTKDPSTIARQIQLDQESCRLSRLPSLLALYLPPPKSEQANAIALHLYPETSMYCRSIRMAQYSGMVQVIKAYLNQMTSNLKHEKLATVVGGLETRKPSKEQIQTALNVLDFFVKNQDMNQINLRTSLEDVIHVLRKDLEIPSETQNSSVRVYPSIASMEGPVSRRKCYICRFLLVSHHAQYSSLCKPCGDFNLASCGLSLPQNLHLEGKTALVTGGRLNLGYHTALRLLRCGAKVIVSTRYPRDAEVRYLAEHDSESWRERLKIIGADFRAASDVFQLVEAVKECLRRWDLEGENRLDVLVNNAAQTLTDPLEKERQAVEQEKRFHGSRFQSQLLLGGSGYEARIRGGFQGSKLLAYGAKRTTMFLEASNADLGPQNAVTDQNLVRSNDTELVPTENSLKSSWMQSLHEIPYEDVITAHSVNTLVPFILIRELVPLMSSPGSSSSRSEARASKPQAYIINVSSREGTFESSQAHPSKNGHHVHTNLTKAALNMLTATEAAPMWKEKRVAINSVDPGYMSAAPEIETRWWEMAMGEQGGEAGRWECPIGWEDGAGRVLWPIAVGEKGEAVWGRFLKHFRDEEVG